MKPKNILAVVFAALLLCLGSATFAGEVTDEVNDETVDEAEIVNETGPVVNINEADATTIASVLLNIGMKKAQAIVDYREKYGRFYSAEEISAIKGIGQITIEKNAGRIVTQ